MSDTINPTKVEQPSTGLTITDAMVRAGVATLYQYNGLSESFWVKEIYLAMRRAAASPAAFSEDSE